MKQWQEGKLVLASSSAMAVHGDAGAKAMFNAVNNTNPVSESHISQKSKKVTSRKSKDRGIGGKESMDMLGSFGRESVLLPHMQH